VKTTITQAHLIVVCCLASIVLTQTLWAADNTKLKPNVLMIVVDDLAPVGSTFGGPVSLPAIDALAERGVSFQTNFANIPVCGASRASMMSGLAPTSSRFLTFDSRLDEDAPNTPSLPQLFRTHGWHTVANGKLFDVAKNRTVAASICRQPTSSSLLQGDFPTMNDWKLPMVLTLTARWQRNLSKIWQGSRS